MPDNLRRHIRYPEDLFTVQAEMYGTYHMTNPTTFYNREDRWEVPRELYRDSEIEVQPYYVMAQMPGVANPGIHADAAAVGGRQEPDGRMARRPIRRRQLRQAGRVPFSQGAVRRRSGAGRVADQFGQSFLGRPDPLGPARVARDPRQSDHPAARRRSAGRDRAYLHRGRADRDSDARPRRVRPAACPTTATSNGPTA